jgi:chromosome segregation ATPase
MKSRRVLSRRKKSTKKRVRRSSTRISFFKKDNPDVKRITMKYKKPIEDSQNKINKIKSEIKNKEDEKAYYTKQKAKKEEEKKKLRGMKGKVSSDIGSIRQRIQVLKNSKNVLEENREKIKQKIVQYEQEQKAKLDNLKM